MFLDGLPTVNRFIWPQQNRVLREERSAAACVAFLECLI